MIFLKINIKKKKKRLEKKNKQKQKGILSLDFIFAFTALYSISMVFALLAITLMMSTVVQYMSFSMARAHISADLDLDEQQLAVENKLAELLGTYLGTFIKENDESWFQIETSSEAATVLEDPGWGGAGDSGGIRQRPYGVSIRFTSLLLKNVRLPILGSPSDGANDDFGSANIYSFLYRQPTTQECQLFNQARWRGVMERFPNIGSMPNILNDDSGSQADNGC